MRIAANLSLLFTELPPAGRYAAAAAAGFAGVEVLFPYDLPAATHAAAAQSAGLPVALINTPAGDWTSGERGFAAIPGAGARFRNDFMQALDYARALGAGLIHVLAGKAAGPEAGAAFRRNLAWAAERAEGLRLTLEPLNAADQPGYFLSSFTQAAAILDDLGHPALGLQFDSHHARRIEGDPLAAWARHGRRAVHVQVAGPGRHEPGAEEAALLAQIGADGFPGWIAGEYVPATTTAAGLGWLSALRA